MKCFANIKIMFIKNHQNIIIKCSILIIIVLNINNIVGDHSVDYNQLSKQISTLIDRRNEDLKLIQNGVIESVLRNPEISNIRNEIDFLKYELGKSLDKHYDNNEQKKFEWVTVSINEIKNQLNEIQNRLNSTVIIQNYQEIDAELSLLRNDVSNLLKDSVSNQRSLKSLEAKDNQFSSEIQSIQNDSQRTANMCSQIRNKMNIFKEDFNKAILKLSGQSKKTIYQSETLFNKNSPLYQRISGGMLEKYRLINENQLKLIDKNQLEINTKLDDVENQISDFKKLQTSVLELFENLENLEIEVYDKDESYRKEISKIDFDLEKIESSIKDLKENDQKRNNDFQLLQQNFQNVQKKLQNDDNEFRKMRSQFNAIEASLRERNQILHNHILKTESTMNPNLNSTVINETSSLSPGVIKEYKSLVNKLPKDCNSVNGPNGIYLILPDETQDPILVNCHNGWILIQNRIDGTVDFNKNWSEYSNGFGVLSGEHWLGNRNLHILTKNNCTMLEIIMLDIYGNHWKSSYQNFFVGDYSQGYKLQLSGYSGNASDAMSYQNLMEFSTIDNDRDISNTHCASNYEGGWWFSHCQHANLNGKYNLGLTWFDSSKNQWIAITQSEMRIKSKKIC